MNRFLKIFLVIACFAGLQGPLYARQNDDGKREREYLVKALVKIADPVLTSLSKNELRKQMPLEVKNEGRKNYPYLEAFGRLLAGMAPWLELGPDASTEGMLRKKYIGLAQQCLHNATDPTSPDFMNFNQGGQPLVDAAFLAQALLRAPKQLWEPLSPATKINILNALRSSRIITPGYSNWLLFSGIIEAAVQKFDRSGDKMRMDYAVRQHLLWYKGDGTYGDGPNFHHDFYNSFVIQPMLLEVVKIMSETDAAQKRNYGIVLKRAQRYAAVQERLISPEGTYPPIGRSLAYRFGAFQLLANIALMKALPQDVRPQQVRAALYAVMQRQLEAPATFDAKNWLRIGMYGSQPGIGEEYITTGSLYLCSQAFLVLGLPDTDEFWQGKDLDWTAKKIWKGENVPADHAID